ncbi:MAG: glycoside hydrolase family 13 protein [Balneolaceae bacterium]|nr:glycoside hydrolase family 13 protein [Balneolaceae bacterium]MBO6545486.1 glycoside hydrolase family 13 protein [Balneolaceae bacterium]MBO6646882.1 glycoside hydrolase family 13 protein [Balneolaceae bacterium]
MKKVFPILFITLLFYSISSAQIEKIDPPFWWVDMPVDELQIQLYGDDLGLYRASLDYPGVSITSQYAVDSPNYLFLYLDVSPDATPGTINITLTHHGKTIELDFKLKEREPLEGRNLGFDSSDLIYLMMPDRFANGDPENDSIEGMLESADRSDPERRQGGDLAGVAKHLDYIQDLGMTAIWFTPTFENDMYPEYGGYHGYAATDLYKVDRRFGTNEEYKALVDKVHGMDMKVIMDMIHNHIGDQHWWMKDLPTKDWVHDWEKEGQTNYRGPVSSDPYASTHDTDRLLNGWFVREMPDLNQKNELLADYLIQNTIWWIEYSGIDGIRMDTYVFPDKAYMARWSKEVLEAYPDFNIVGEAWLNFPGPESYWQYDQEGVDDGYNSHLPSVTDFPLAQAVDAALNENFGWDNGVARIWNILTNDFLYKDPMKNVIFLDNHDMDRIYERVRKDEDHFKMAYTFLLTTRGIPQVYYGTELMMKHEYRGGDDEYRRPNMPGGWEGDERSVFTREGRTDKENEIYDFVSHLGKWRQTSDAVRYGRLLHFVPQNGIYVYFRIHENQTVMVVMNQNKEAATIPRDILSEVLDSFDTGKNIFDNSKIDLSKDFEVDRKVVWVWELE